MKYRRPIRRERPEPDAQTLQVSPRRAKPTKAEPWASRFTDREIQEILQRDSNRPRSRDGRRRGNQYTCSSPRLRGGADSPTRHTTDSPGVTGLTRHPQMPFGKYGFVKRYREEG